mmetsp:Transcript_23546/g.20898  ORF Transcript_23546/g.20898 Transcript_23546/m.20898 type:complete len:119 (+) Transcript_23546:371-727(+)
MCSKKTSINEKLLRKMTTGLASFASQFGQSNSKLNEDTVTDDVEVHRYKGRKKQSCQPKQINSNSNRNVMSTFTSPKHSWMNTFISHNESHKKEESKLSKNEDRIKKPRIKMLRDQMI